MQPKTVIGRGLNELNEQPKKWLMSFNPDEAKIMIFSNINIAFSFNGKAIPKFTKDKYLDVALLSSNRDK